jgi:RNA polymerase sigma-70 factor (ECF subfamily)
MAAKQAPGWASRSAGASETDRVGTGRTFGQWSAARRRGHNPVRPGSAGKVVRKVRPHRLVIGGPGGPVGEFVTAVANARPRVQTFTAASTDAWIDGLVARAQAGDGDAFGHLYDVYAPRVYRFLLLRVREPADAEDLLQGVFVRTVEALPRYEARGLPFAAWLFRVAQNVATDLVRAHRPADQLEAADHASAALDPQIAAQAAATRDGVHQAIAALTPDQREVIVYRFFAGLSAAEIGRAMGKREGSVRALQFRALEAMRRALPGDTA